MRPMSSRSSVDPCQSELVPWAYSAARFVRRGAARSARAPDTQHVIGLPSAATALQRTRVRLPKTSWFSSQGRRGQWRFFAAAVLVAMMMISVAGLRPATAANGSVTYTYDALGRVSTASYDTNVIVIYTYDANGNRTAQTINLNTATLTWTATATPCTMNCWGAGLW